VAGGVSNKYDYNYNRNNNSSISFFDDSSDTDDKNKTAAFVHVENGGTNGGGTNGGRLNNTNRKPSASRTNTNTTTTADTSTQKTNNVASSSFATTTSTTTTATTVKETSIFSSPTSDRIQRQQPPNSSSNTPVRAQNSPMRTTPNSKPAQARIPRSSLRNNHKPSPLVNTAIAGSTAANSGNSGNAGTTGTMKNTSGDYQPNRYTATAAAAAAAARNNVNTNTPSNSGVKNQNPQLTRIQQMLNTNSDNSDEDDQNDEDKDEDAALLQASPRAASIAPPRPPRRTFEENISSSTASNPAQHALALNLSQRIQNMNQQLQQQQNKHQHRQPHHQSGGETTDDGEDEDEDEDEDDSTAFTTNSTSFKSRQSTIRSNGQETNMYSTPTRSRSHSRSHSHSHSHASTYTTNATPPVRRHNMTAPEELYQNTTRTSNTSSAMLPYAHELDDAKSVNSIRSYYSKSAHRSRAHLDPQMNFLHESVLLAAKIDLGTASSGHTNKSNTTYSARNTPQKYKYAHQHQQRRRKTASYLGLDSTSRHSTAPSIKSSLWASSPQLQQLQQKQQIPESSPSEVQPKTTLVDLEQGTTQNQNDHSDHDDNDSKEKKEVFQDEDEPNNTSKHHQQQQQQEHDEHLDFLDWSNSNQGVWIERLGWTVLCCLFLGFWFGVVPYSIIRYQNLDANEKSSLISPPADVDATVPTTAPTLEMIPWTNAPTFSPPESKQPTPAPTDVHDNQELLDVLGEEGDNHDDDTDTIVVGNGTMGLNDTEDGEDSDISNNTTPTSTIFPTTINTTTNGDATVAPTVDPVMTTAPSTFISPTSGPTMAPTVLVLSTSAPSGISNMTTLTVPPTIGPTEQPDVVFPDYTLAAFSDASSPQSRAFSWMLRDPHFGKYLPNQIRQRFALAVLYYATNGDQWTLQQQDDDKQQQGEQPSVETNRQQGGFIPWMTYEGHECDWYYRREPPSDENDPEMQQLQEQQQQVICQDEIWGNEVFRSYRSLWLENNQLEGELPAELAMLTGLREVQLGSNALFGTLPAAWFLDDKDTAFTWQMSLEGLHLKNNFLTGRVPTEIGLAKNLEWIDLQSNRLSETVPTEIGSLIALTHLLWNDNAFSGAIPSEIGRMRNLTVASFTSNQLNGTIPEEIVGCWSLAELYLGENRLTGSIPWHLGLLHGSLMQLHLQSNAFSSSIPTRLGLLTGLQWLDLGDNGITGEIPLQLGDMVALQNLQLENNALQGPLPSNSLAALDQVSRVWLYGNPDLSGTTPESWCSVVSDGTGTIGTVDIKVNCDGSVVCTCEEGCSCV